MLTIVANLSFLDVYRGPGHAFASCLFVPGKTTIEKRKVNHFLKSSLGLQNPQNNKFVFSIENLVRIKNSIRFLTV